MTITQGDLIVARWRCRHRFQIPHDQIDDVLQDAIVNFLEHDNPLKKDPDQFAIGNWLALVAYRRHLDRRKTLATRRTRQWPADREEQKLLQLPQPEQTTKCRSHIQDRVEHLMSFATPKQRTTLELLLRCGSKARAARALGVSPQVVGGRIVSLLKALEEKIDVRLPAPPRTHAP